MSSLSCPPNPTETYTPQGKGPAAAHATARGSLAALAPYLLLGSVFGITLTKSEALSWYRIQEMFRFQSFHMYGIIVSAVVVAAVSVALIKWLRFTDLRGEPIEIPPKQLGRGHGVVIGGVLFGIGWGLTGACPGPLLALLGSGVTVASVVLLSALAGTWTYAHLGPGLPH